MTTLTHEFLEAARDAFAYRATHDPEHRSYWVSRVVEANRVEAALLATPAPPVLTIKHGDVVIGGQRHVTRLSGALLAARVLQDGQATFTDQYATPGAAREALRRFSNYLDRQREHDLAERVWRIRCTAEGLAHLAT